jgi:hypothetical protein
MTVWAEVSRVAMGLNVLLLGVLCSIWARNYREFGSKHSLGLLAFGALVLAENALGLYYFTWHPKMAGWFFGLPETHATAMLSLQVLETFAVAFLLWVTWD